MVCHGGCVVMDGERGAAMMIRRTEIMSIGEQLVAASARAGPLDIARVGGLLRRLALAYGQCGEGDEVRRRATGAMAGGLAPERRKGAWSGLGPGVAVAKGSGNPHKAAVTAAAPL